ncbi:survival protein sure-like phosphatase/nucleotidase [Leptodontidium sp. MPI-SDFR-AT-0119]|nr:survival protein sure-like phosphatase/nucleotidase [Leptodontidium sp. MPI-SDFR-AT-0119]
MHILVVNDDGPPSNQSSPYVHSLVKSLQEAGHIVSVVLPHTQRSWIGKAHIIGQTVKPTYFRPGTLHQDDGTTHSRPLPAGAKEQEEWVLVDGTPASCVQIGLYHFFQDRGPIDLVVSGPNYGRNSTAVFSLSSGTLGGALEAAVCKRRAIALSYAFFSRNHDPEIIAGASKLSVKLIDYLYANWGKEVDLYSVNVPLLEGVEGNKIMWTNMLQNYWSEGSCFQEVVDEEGDADEEEQKLREREGQGGDEGANGEGEKVMRHKHKHFKWAPRFTDVYKSVEDAPPGNDGWAVKEGYTSVTPLKANFMHAAAQTEGELKLNPRPSPTLPAVETPTLSESQPFKTKNHFYALINYEDAYVQPLILEALKARFTPDSYTLISSLSELPTPSTPFLQISSYESLPFEQILSHPTSSLINAYIIRKALIRKHYLSTTAYNWTTKNPSSILATNIKPACEFEVDYAEFLDDALVEAWELQESWRKGEELSKEEREWWILKPGMSDRGQGIRLFSSEEELQGIFDEWEAERPDSDDENEDEDEDEDENEETATGKASEADGKGGNEEKEGDFIVTSHLRHFIAQPYIHPPLLLPGNPRKFHIRTYVLALGSLKVYVYKPMLALFAATPYVPPWSSTTTSTFSNTTDLSPHLTNTCLQTGAHDGSVHSFFSLPDSQLPPSQKEDIFAQICATTSEVFEAAARGMSVHFQTLPNAFEVFGLDFLVDERGTAWLLECNAFPDFRQTGEELKGLVGGLWREVVGVAVGGFFGVEGVEGKGEGEGEMVLVRDVDLGRR